MKNKRLRIFSLFAVTALAAICLRPSHAFSAEDKEYDQATIAAAKQEKSVLFLTGAGQGKVVPKLAETFESRYGIRMDYELGRGSENEEKVRTQRRAGRVLADAISTGLGNFASLQDSLDLFDVPNSQNMGRAIQALNLPKIPLYINFYGIIVNTQRVAPNDFPRSWDDLLNPKWKGQIVMDDPGRSGGGGNMFQSLMRAKGAAYWQKMAAQKPHISARYPDNEKALGRGEFSIYIPAQISGLFRLGKIAPVRFIEPKEGGTTAPVSVGQVKGAPHPNAAKLLLNFLLSKEAQALYATEGLVPVSEGVKVPLPEMAVERVKFIYSRTSEDYAKEEEEYRVAAKIFGLVR